MSGTEIFALLLPRFPIGALSPPASGEARSVAFTLHGTSDRRTPPKPLEIIRHADGHLYGGRLPSRANTFTIPAIKRTTSTRPRPVSAFKVLTSIKAKPRRSEFRCHQYRDLGLNATATTAYREFVKGIQRKISEQRG